MKDFLLLKYDELALDGFFSWADAWMLNAYVGKDVGHATGDVWEPGSGCLLFT